MIVSVALAVAALRAGLILRRSRAARRAPPRGARQRHLRLAKPAIVLLLIGFVAGPVSAVLLRGWSPFATFHGVLGALVTALFAAAAVHGYRLEGGRREARSTHAVLGGLAVLGAIVAAVAGFVLLP
jgi:polyferredoxin